MDPSQPGAADLDPATTYAAELAEATGRYYTQGMPEDTKALSAGVLDRDEFLAQARHRRRARTVAQYLHLLTDFRGGLLFYYFGNGDLMQPHDVALAWTPSTRPTTPRTDAPYADVIPALYARMDEMVGETLDAHGRRHPGDRDVRPRLHALAAHLPPQRLAPRERLPRGARPRACPRWRPCSNVDWTRTRAYGLGLNGLYVNLAGRERGAWSSAGDRERLADELQGQAAGGRRPGHRRAGGHARSTVRDAYFGDGGDLEIGPDLVVGYSQGHPGVERVGAGRGRDPGVRPTTTSPGAATTAWTTTSVPGILVTSRPLVAAGDPARQPGGGDPGRVRRRRLSGPAGRTEGEEHRCSAPRPRSSSTRSWSTRCKRYAQIAGYSSVEEFITHALEKELAKLEDADSEEEIKKRLQGLGYIPEGPAAWPSSTVPRHTWSDC